MNLPMDVVKIASFDEEHQHPKVIKDIRADLDLMNKIVREHIIFLANRETDISSFISKLAILTTSMGRFILYLAVVNSNADNLRPGAVRRR